MKRPYLLAILVCLLSVPALAQERQRFFDNFDTNRGVQVQRPPAPAVPRTNSAAKTVKGSKKQRALAVQNIAANKTAAQQGRNANPLVKRTVMSRMSVGEGFADREIARTLAGNGSLSTQPAPRYMGPVAGMRGFTTGDTTIDGYIVDSSRRYNVDPLLIYSQMHQESSFKLKATSYKGASGLMQLMPATARRLGVTNIYDPRQNIEGGVKYMRILLDMFGQDINLALAGYNAGEGAVQKYGNTIPPYSETREYVRRISTRYMSISDGSYARSVRKVTSSQAAKLEKKPAAELTYRQDAVAIRLADGRMRLVNQ